MQAGGTGRGQGQIGALEAELDRHMARDHVDDRRRHKKWGDTAWPPGHQFPVGLLDHGQAADTGADVAADPAGLFLAERITDLQARIGHCINARGQPQVNEAVHMARFFLGDVPGDVETLDLACKLAGEGAHIELGDRVDARIPGQQVGPGFGDGISDRSEATESGHDDAAFGHAGIPFWKLRPLAGARRR